MEIVPDSTAKPRAGQFLLSEPFLTDPWFGRKTVFLCDHDADGTVGLVLDNGTGRRLKEVLPESEAWGIDHEVSLGGPVHDDSLFFLLDCHLLNIIGRGLALQKSHNFFHFTV